MFQWHRIRSQYVEMFISRRGLLAHCCWIWWNHGKLMLLQMWGDEEKVWGSSGNIFVVYKSEPSFLLEESHGITGNLWPSGSQNWAECEPQKDRSLKAKTLGSGPALSLGVRTKMSWRGPPTRLLHCYWIIFHSQHLLLIPGKSLLLDRNQLCEWMAGCNYSFPNLRAGVEKWGWRYGPWCVDIDWVQFYAKRSITSNFGNHSRTCCLLLNMSKSTTQF